MQKKLIFTQTNKRDAIEADCCRRGFSLIELLIAMLIVAMMTAAVIPFMQRMQLGYERNQFIAHVDSLVQTAWQQAIMTGKVHRILFTFAERTAVIERDITKSALAKKLEFEPVVLANATMSWPSSIEIHQFIIEGFDEMKRSAEGRSKTVWFYLIPDGMTQAVIINAVDKDERINNKPKPFSLVLNPFLAQFKVYDAFQS